MGRLYKWDIPRVSLGKNCSTERNACHLGMALHCTEKLYTGQTISLQNLNQRETHEGVSTNVLNSLWGQFACRR